MEKEQKVPEKEPCLEKEQEKAVVEKVPHPQEYIDGRDGGWAWFVAFAACLINFIMAGLGRMSGILYVVFIEKFHVGRKEASSPFSVRSSTRNLLGPIVGILGEKYGVRTVTITGGIIGSLSAASCFFADDITWITVLWGGINGVGSSLTLTLPQVVIGQYFDRYRTTASGMAFSGGCVGAFLFPAILESLLADYDMQGTFLIMGAIIMHTIPAAMILRKPYWLKNKTIKTNKQDIEKPEQVKFADNSSDDEKKILPSNRSDLKSTDSMYLVSDMRIPSDRKIRPSSLSINQLEMYEDEVDFQFLRQNKELVVQILISVDPSMLKENFHEVLKDAEADKNLESEDKYIIVKALEDLFLKLEDPFFEDDGFESEVFSPVFSEGTPIGSGVKSSSYLTPKTPGKSKLIFNFSRSYSEADNVFDGKSTSVSAFNNETSKKYFILTRLGTLYDKSEDQIASDSMNQNKYEVPKILLELRKVYKLCKAESTFDAYDLTKNTVLSIKSKHNSLKPVVVKCKVVPEETVPEIPEKSNSFLDHIKTAFKMHGNPLFLLICVCRAVHFLTLVPIITVVVDFGMDKGLLEEDGKYIIAALSLGDLLGRLCLGWITDRKYLSLPKYMLVVMVIQGVSTASLPMMDTKFTLLLTVAIFGMLQGSLFVRHAVLVSKYMGSNEQSIAMGCVNFLSGFVGFGLPSYIGFFRDTLGSYDYMFYVTGAIGCSVGLLWTLEPYCLQCTSQEQSEEDLDDTEC